LNHFDAIVVGVGGIGSAALAHLAQKGLHVLGLEQFKVGHDKGSSHGQTRVIRQVYFEHPSYVPLLQRAYALWDVLDENSAQSLFVRSGLVQFGAADGQVIRGVEESAQQYGLPVERLTEKALRELAPMLRLPESMVAVYEQGAGYLAVEDCVRAHARTAVQAGATLMQGETVQSWKADGAGFVVTTQSDRYSTDRLVVTAGAWSDRLLLDLGVELRVRRKPLLWFGAEETWEKAPVFLYELPEGVFYGFPDCGGRGVKIAEHTSGLDADPDVLNRDLLDADRDPVQAFSRRYLRGVNETDCQSHAVCMYTMTPDEHFCVGTHPKNTRLVFAAGMSGHGFKFASVLGEILSELAMDGKSQHEISFLSPSRFEGSFA